MFSPLGTTRLKNMPRKLPFRAVWYEGNGYAWQDTDFLQWKHALAIRTAQWRMLFIGMTTCSYSAWEHPCILFAW